MPFSSRDLSVAVLIHNSLDRVQTILADRDHNGVPYADINATNDYGSTILMTMLAVSSARRREINIDILQSFLDVRDYKNNPVINLNAYNTMDRQSIIHYLLNKNIAISSEQRSQLLQQIIELRDATGRLVLHLENVDRSFLSLLGETISLNDSHIMGILLDTRGINGNRILNVNEINIFNQTILDEAMRRHPINPELVTVIQQAGGLQYHDLSVDEKQLNRKERQGWIAAVTPTTINQPSKQDIPTMGVTPMAVTHNQVAQNFAQNPQNIHNKYEAIKRFGVFRSPNQVIGPIGQTLSPRNARY